MSFLDGQEEARPVCGKSVKYNSDNQKYIDFEYVELEFLEYSDS